MSVHAAGKLAPAVGVLDAMRQTKLEAARTALYYFYGKNETFAVGGAIPFGLIIRQMSAWTFHGNGLKLMRKLYEGAKLKPFPADLMNAAFKPSMKLYAELPEQNLVWSKVFADDAKFRGEQKLWFRFTEATFDGFTQRQKLQHLF